MADAPAGILLSFAVTSLIIEMTPGPNMAYLAALALAQGRRAGFAAVAGIALGLAVYGMAVALGLGAVIDRSESLYQGLRWGGVVYLFWLAWEAWAAERDLSSAGDGRIDISAGAAFRRGLITNLLNPKAAIFYVAVLPEFIQIGRGSVGAQTFTLSAIYVAVATLVHVTIVLLASRLQDLIHTPQTRRTIRRALALLLAGIAVWLAASTGR
jgi:threonine/homoserine/homoserine lactone efflux protein